jgi:hypothetical protein
VKAEEWPSRQKSEHAWLGSNMLHEQLRAANANARRNSSSRAQNLGAEARSLAVLSLGNWTKKLAAIKTVEFFFSAAVDDRLRYPGDAPLS